MDEKKSTELVPVSETRAELPPILAGRHTAAVEAQVRSFYLSVARHFERWVTRRSSSSTRSGPTARTSWTSSASWDSAGPRNRPGSSRSRSRTCSRFAIRCSPSPRPPRPSTAGSRACPRSTSTSRVWRPSFGCPSRSRIRPRPVHPPGLVGPARRDEGPVGDPCPAAHGAPLRRHGVRLPGPGHHQVLPL